MKLIRLLSVIALGFLPALSPAGESPSDPDPTFSDLAGDYLGQEPPGLKPVLFAPVAVSTDTSQERDATFSPDLKEFYFTRDAAIMVMKNNGQEWTVPQPVAFSSGHQEFEAFVAPDGQRLYYISRRPIKGETEPGFYHIWFVQRRGSAWGEPRLLSEQRDFYPTVSTNGVMYVTDENNDLYRTEMVDGFMSSREKLGDSINTARAEYNSCIAPDESFIIFTSFGWGDGFGGGDLFVSFRKEDGSWAQARNMGGGINSAGHDYCPAISPDGRYLFFTSNRRATEDLYWVDAGLIDSLRTNDLNTADMLYNAVVEHGPGVARGAYNDLKSRYSDYCFFDGQFLSGVGDRFLAANKTAEAIELMRLGADLYPDSQTVVQWLKFALVAEDDTLYDRMERQLEVNQENLTQAYELQLNALGYRLMWWGKLPQAIKILRLNVELFPGSFNVYDSYAEVLLANGDTLAAIENYEKSLELNPNNTNAETILKTLRGE